MVNRHASPTTSLSPVRRDLSADINPQISSETWDSPSILKAGMSGLSATTNHTPLSHNETQHSDMHKVSGHVRDRENRPNPDRKCVSRDDLKFSEPPRSDVFKNGYKSRHMKHSRDENRIAHGKGDNVYQYRDQDDYVPSSKKNDSLNSSRPSNREVSIFFSFKCSGFVY